MLTDDWYPALTQPNVELVTDADRRGHAGRASGPRMASSARPTCSCSPPASRPTGSSRRWRSSAPADGRWPRSGPRSPRAYLGLSVPGFPNMFLLYGPNTNGGTGSVIYTIEAGIGHVIAALRELDRAGAARIEVRREAAEAFDRELRGALRKTVWHTGCTNWYVDENGNDPNQWPWTVEHDTAGEPRRSRRTAYRVPARRTGSPSRSVG